MIWSDELRHVSVLFVNLGFDAETELANMQEKSHRTLMQDVVFATQEVVYHYEGSLVVYWTLMGCPEAIALEVWVHHWCCRP